MFYCWLSFLSSSRFFFVNHLEVLTTTGNNHTTKYHLLIFIRWNLPIIFAQSHFQISIWYLRYHYLENCLNDFLIISWAAQNCDTNDILSEINGAIAILQRENICFKQATLWIKYNAVRVIQYHRFTVDLLFWILTLKVKQILKQISESISYIRLLFWT